jgi:hypothetical protein
MEIISWETYQKRNNISGFDYDEYEKWSNKYFDIYSDKELGINTEDYFIDGHYKDYTGNEYDGKQNYLILRKFYLEEMKPIKDDFSFIELHYEIIYYKEKYDYSFIKSPSIRHLLLNEPLPDTDKNDPYFILLDYEKRAKIYKLIELLDKTENINLKNAILDKIDELHTEDYIVTKWEYHKLVIYDLIRKKVS